MIRLIIKGKNGFTLIELLAVIVILGIIMLIAIPIANGVIDTAKKNSFLNNAKLIAQATTTCMLGEQTKDNAVQDIINVCSDPKKMQINGYLSNYNKEYGYKIGVDSQKNQLDYFLSCEKTSTFNTFSNTLLSNCTTLGELGVAYSRNYNSGDWVTEKITIEEQNKLIAEAAYKCYNDEKNNNNNYDKCLDVTSLVSNKYLSSYPNNYNYFYGFKTNTINEYDGNGDLAYFLACSSVINNTYENGNSKIQYYSESEKNITTYNRNFIDRITTACTSDSSKKVNYIAYGTIEQGSNKYIWKSGTK